MKRVLLITAGNISLGLGIVGVFLPVLPTTPFLILSATCFLNSSGRLYNWLINHRVLGLYIRSYMKYKAISLKSKIVAIIIMWVFILSSAIFFVPILWVKFLLIVIATVVTIHISRIKTLTKDMLEEV